MEAKPNEPKLDAQFADYLRDDSPIDRLEKQILTEGCCDRLVVWKETGLLIDGYRRLGICRKHNIPYAVRQVSLPNRSSALLWMFNNQEGRRNWRTGKRALAAARYKKELAHEAAQREAETQAKPGEGKVGRPGVVNLPPPEKTGKSRDLAGKAMGVSGSTVDAGEKVVDGGTKALQEAVDKGAVSVSAAAKATARSAPEQDKLAEDALAGKKPHRKPRQAAKPKAEAPEGEVCPTCKGTGRIPAEPVKQEPDPIWDAWCAVFGLKPVTKNERTRIGAHVRDLKLKGATPEIIRDLHKRYKAAWPDIDCTPEALLKHWDQLAAKEIMGGRGKRQESVFGAPATADSGERPEAGGNAAGGKGPGGGFPRGKSLRA